MSPGPWRNDDASRVEVVAVLIHPIIPFNSTNAKKNENLTTKPIKDPDGWTHSD
jgi:hypothetical protein